MIPKAALVLEGGSMRCLFTAGVLDIFLEQEIYFPYVIGVSAGSLSGINYVAKQMGRTAQVNIRFAGDKRYLGLSSLMRTRSIFNFDFIFGEVSQRLIPLDYDTFLHSEQRYIAVSTDCETGKAKFHEKGTSQDIFLGARASSSIPLLSPMVRVDGSLCVDGGVAMPIPLQKAMEDGYEKVVLVLTRDATYAKPPVKRSVRMLYQRAYKRYPKLLSALEQGPTQYNKLLDEIKELEEAGRIFVFRPEQPVTVSRMEKNPDKLRALYTEGKNVASQKLEAMRAYLET